MNLLILGGTQFVGRHIVERAITRGHDVTIFHRGKTGSELFPGAERLIGDRKKTEDLAVLAGRGWDAVIDTCGYFPADVRRSSELLKQAVGRYIFISSISVYSDFSRGGMDETGPLATTDDADATEITAQNYGGLKVLCEQALDNVFADRSTIVRPGFIVGPNDPFLRLNYWCSRIAKGGEVLAPGDPRRQIQFIDARDLAEFTVELAETGTPGTFNATGPESPLEMRTFLEACRSAVRSDATFTWVSDVFLLKADLSTFRSLPLWIPEEPETVGAGSIDFKRAIAAGMTLRPYEATISETLESDRSRGSEAPNLGLLDPDKETAILADWRHLTQPYRA